ncbi:MAG: phosphatase PAP2 family protein [Clostridia bacterium]|nr:phosphatase PAP2 family protein [Clostridia bacterium]
MNKKPRAPFSASAFDASFLARLVPRYALLSAPFCLVLDCAVYWFTKAMQILTGWQYHALLVPLDRKTPFVPAFMWVYVGCFLFWIVTFAMTAHTGKARWYRFFTANALGLLICGAIFVLLPTKIDRPEITGTGLTAWLCRIIYASDTPVNLFPSIHCFGSWMSFIGVRGQKRFPLWVRVFVPVYTLAVCASTLLVKQHFFLDVVAGIALAELLWFLVGRFPETTRPAEKAFGAADRYLFG